MHIYVYIRGQHRYYSRLFQLPLLLCYYWQLNVDSKSVYSLPLHLYDNFHLVDFDSSGVSL